MASANQGELLECGGCKKSFAYLNKLSCSHAQCDKCLAKNTKNKMMKCATCKLHTNKPPTKIASSESLRQELQGYKLNDLIKIRKSTPVKVKKQPQVTGVRATSTPKPAAEAVGETTQLGDEMTQPGDEMTQPNSEPTQQSGEETAASEGEEKAAYTALKHQAVTLVKIYHRDLERREEQIGNEIGKLRKAVETTDQEKEKQLDGLSDQYERRLEQLKSHFGKLKVDVVTAIEKRQEQLKTLVTDLETLVVDLKDEMKEMRTYYEEILKQKDEEIERQSVERLREQTKHEKSLEVAVPGLDFGIQEADGLSLEDTINISAPDPQLVTSVRERAIPDTALIEENLLPLRVTSLAGAPESLTVINNELYSCEAESGIAVLNLDLSPVRRIPSGIMGDIYSTAGLPDLSIVIAASKGLFHTYKDGAMVGRVAEQKHMCVVSAVNVVYAARESTKDKRVTQIRSYQFNSRKWKQLQVFTLPCPARHDVTLTLHDDVIFAGCVQESTIFVVSRDSGTVLRQEGKIGGGATGRMDDPRIAGYPAENSIIVCDHGNNRMQVLTRSGAWFLGLELQGPIGACVAHSTLYVSTINKKLHAFGIQKKVERN